MNLKHLLVKTMFYITIKYKSLLLKKLKDMSVLEHIRHNKLTVIKQQKLHKLFCTLHGLSEIYVIVAKMHTINTTFYVTNHLFLNNPNKIFFKKRFCLKINLNS